jgi:hypothetical protein
MDDWSELYLWPSLIAFFAFIILLPLTVFGIIRITKHCTATPLRGADEFIG